MRPNKSAIRSAPSSSIVRSDCRGFVWPHDWSGIALDTTDHLYIHHNYTPADYLFSSSNIVKLFISFNQVPFSMTYLFPFIIFPYLFSHCKIILILFTHDSEHITCKRDAVKLRRDAKKGLAYQVLVLVIYEELDTVTRLKDTLG